jgi:hypothetical protein
MRQRPSRTAAAAPAAIQRTSWTNRLLALLERRAALIALLLVGLASARIAATYGVFNHTSDEPAHIACGMEWLANGTYRLEAQHPPLARAAAALGPWLAGIRYPEKIIDGELDMYFRGQKILYSGGHYARNLALSRLGILPFFWLGCLVTYLWGRRTSGAVAALAVFCFSFTPTVLAHAGLATTDMALTACLAAAFLAGLTWLEKPTLAHAAWFGAAGGLALLSKHSALVYFPAAAAAAFAWHFAANRPPLRRIAADALRRAPGLALAAAVAFLVVWAGFRFSFGKVYFANMSLPFPEYFEGIRQVIEHDRVGHLSYLLGRISPTGFWQFYPVALAVKTPIGFLLLLGGAAWLAWRKREAMRGAGLAAAFPAGILLTAAFSHINIGLRHVLPVYVAFSIIAAIACAELLREASRPWIRRGALAAMLWFGLSSLLSHPDYLPYFNAFAGSEPEKILADSDLDWGQDCWRLGQRLRELHAPEVYFAPSVNANVESELGFPPAYLAQPLQPGPGWNAISISNWKIRRLGLYLTQPDAVLWPDRFQPVERVGKSILLYYFPPSQFRH